MEDGAVHTSIKKCDLFDFIENKMLLYTYNPFPNHFIIEKFCRQAADKMGQCGVTIFTLY
jgi:hypothetical protein